MDIENRKVIHRRSSEAGKVPTAEQCEYGEIFINYASGDTNSFLSYKKADNTIVTIHDDDYWEEKLAEVEVSGTTIIDDVDSDDSDAALSARQGKLLNERIETLENAPSNSVNFKKDSLKLYRELGRTNQAMKPFTDELRSTMIGLDEFAKLGTGLFIHWGIYAVPAGNYTGPKQEGSTVPASTTATSYNTEWIMRDLAIPRDIYKAYEDDFTAENWDPEELCKMASECGMGYVVVTLKHHDGFSLYPTEYGSWDVRTSAARNTIIDELKEACDKYHLKFGVYFSHFWDWMAEGGFGLDYGKKWTTSDLYNDAQHTTYCNLAALQINEMIEKYEPFLLWYDPGTGYNDKYKNIFIQSEENSYPHVITNDRLDYSRTRGDYGTGERTIYLRNSLPVAEACFTMNSTWGYSDNNENKYYSIETVFKQFLIYSLAYGQNCLMNIGPKADGSVPTKQIECLNSIKAFSNNYGGFKNYKRANKLSMPKWGYMLELENNTILCYVVTSGNPSTQEVTIDCVDLTNFESVDILTPGESASAEILDNKILIHNLSLDSETKIGVVRLNYSMPPVLMDANYYSAGENIPSRVFPMKNGATWDFAKLAYSLKPSSALNNTTEFIWDDDDSDYNITLDYDILSESPISTDDIITITITDILANTSQTIVYEHDTPTSEDSVSLVNGNRYKLSLVCSGTNSNNYYRLKSFAFSKKPVIVHPTSITLNETSVMVTKDGTTQLIATVLPTDTTDPSVIWESADENYATVEDGLVIGVAAGETTVSAKTVDGGLTATCTIIITDEIIVEVDSVTLDETSLDINVNDTHQLTATIMPADATYKAVIWESDDESKVTVSGGLVTGVALGSATIKAKSAYDQTKYDTCIVTVSPVLPESVTLNEHALTMIPGFEETLTATVLPATTTDKSVTWSSSDSAVASVDENGKIFAKTSGSTVITVTTSDGQHTDTCTVTVQAEEYNYLFEALSLNADINQGEDTGIKLFSDELQNWTLFGYVNNNINTYRPGTTSTFDKNATFYQCVVNSSPWTGVRVDAYNNASTTINATVPMRFRFMAGTDNYVNATTGQIMGSTDSESVDDPKHPICISRDGNTYKFSTNGVDWTAFNGLNATQLARLVDCPLTVGFDYTRSSGSMTNTKYRFLHTENPCCLSIKYQSEYPFYTLYQKYDYSRQ